MYKKKSLGQHFLKSSAYLRTVVDAGEVEAGDAVLEIGPGDGALTQEILSRGAKVLAIEKDHRLLSVLEETFSKEIASEKLEVVEGDALWIDISIHFKSKGKGYKVVANIPYYITGALLRKLLTEKFQPTCIVVLVQKEVAERITRSNPDVGRSGPRPKRRGKESLLSLSVKAYGIPEYVKTVPRGAFAPPPNVDSAILRIKNISRSNFKNTQQEKRFFGLIHAGFAQKRKLLARNLESVLGENTLLYMQQAGIAPNARAEDVPLPSWLALSKVGGFAK